MTSKSTSKKPVSVKVLHTYQSHSVAVLAVGHDVQQRLPQASLRWRQGFALVEGRKVQDYSCLRWACCEKVLAHDVDRRSVYAVLSRQASKRPSSGQRLLLERFQHFVRRLRFRANSECQRTTQHGEKTARGRTSHAGDRRVVGEVERSSFHFM